MKHILSRENLEVLEQFAWSKVLLAFDYDGTLAPIAADPARATLRPATRRLLEELASLYPCIVISGRAQADAARRLEGLRLCAVVGNHGMEPWRATGAMMKEVQRWRPLLRKRLAGLQGVKLEDKVFSVAIHYRLSREKKKARVAIREAASSLGKVRLIGGKQLVNILPHGAPHKGFALERERARWGCDTAIYVGDDETDEDVFAVDQPGQLLSIRVGKNRTSAAPYYLRSQAEVGALIRALISLRRRAARVQLPCG